jgi:hypothetical protein
MPGAIAKWRGQSLAPEVSDELNRSEDIDWLSTCLLLPLKGTFWLLKRLSRKIFYFLTVKEATDQISYYWHLAFLTDYALASGHLDNPGSAQIARQTMEQILQTITTSPLLQLAQRVTAQVHHIFRTLLRVRRKNEEDEVVQHTKLEMSNYWSDFAGYLEILAQHYDRVYQELSNPQAGAEVRTSL